MAVSCETPTITFIIINDFLQHEKKNPNRTEKNKAQNFGCSKCFHVDAVIRMFARCEAKASAAFKTDWSFKVWKVFSGEKAFVLKLELGLFVSFS